MRVFLVMENSWYIPRTCTYMHIWYVNTLVATHEGHPGPSKESRAVDRAGFDGHDFYLFCTGLPPTWEQLKHVEASEIDGWIVVGNAAQG